ncbi:GtrA family protein [Cellulomonas endometrii]|uniref:GtrA family protein n=1 Tax=Cellulomonas endometrii TaxID=3036301 RepID=UPI0024AD34D0|nr:GtrA family protein [Cellulomonas endometrii]
MLSSSRAPGLAAAPGPAREARPGRLSAALRARALELARFGSVGTVAFVVDLGTYNLLRFGPVDALHGKPLTARIIAVVLATLVSWLGSRHWTFADQRTHGRGRELALFAVINALGIGITVGTLWFSHYVLDMRGPFADNVANVIGIGLGTVLRYVGYKLFVFTGTSKPPVALAAVGHEARAHGASGATGATGAVPRPRPGETA